MPQTWMLPYRPGRGRWIVAAWEAGALAFLQVTTVNQFGLGPRAATLLTALLLGLWISGCWRLATMGVYVGDRGVRVRGLVGQRTVAWQDVDRIAVEPATWRLGSVEVPLGPTVLLDLRDGSRVGTNLWAKGVDFQFRPALFREVYEGLRRRHARAIA